MYHCIEEPKFPLIWLATMPSNDLHHGKLTVPGLVRKNPAGQRIHLDWQFWYFIVEKPWNIDKK